MKTKNGKIKQVFFYAIICFFLICFLEGASWVAFTISFGNVFSYNTLAQQRLEIANKSKLTPAAQDASSRAYLIHPYFGYVLNPAWINSLQTSPDAKIVIREKMNEFGFFGTSPIQHSESNKVIIGISGGSVAAYLGSWGKVELLKELANLPAFANKELVLINLGSAAYKQPQQVMVVSDILSQGGHFDLFINLDGFNEIALPMGHGSLAEDTSPFFPQNWRLTTESSFSTRQLGNLAKIAIVESLEKKLAQWFSNELLAHSVFGNLIWKTFDSAFAHIKLISELDMHSTEEGTRVPISGSIRTTKDHKVSLGPLIHFHSTRELYIELSQHWARSSVLLNNMIVMQGGQYFHFLQPNQYFKGSKPILSEEATVALNPASPYRKEVERGYPYLRSAGDILKNAGVNFIDLAGVFKSESKPLYIDSCCHLTQEGNNRLAKKIVDEIRHMSVQGSDNKIIHANKINNMDFSQSNLRKHAYDLENFTDGSETKLSLTHEGKTE